MRIHLLSVGRLMTLMLLGYPVGVALSEEVPIEARWYASGGLGALMFEGDEELENGVMAALRFGYDYSEWWSFEASFAFAPSLDENFRFDVPTQQQVSRLEESSGDPSADGTYGLGVSMDALFHFTRWERLDPYLTVGVGAQFYGEDLGGNSFDPAFRVGGGVMYHFNDEWAARVDGRTYIAGDDTEANASFDAGFIWRWGARVPSAIVASDEAIDSDGDGLFDWREMELGTDPYNPDTDGDGLTDYGEVIEFNTDPLNPDTDYDGLTDYEEVKSYSTDPLDVDTDDGGVSDGHEVLDDGTNPLDPSDDLLLFELYIQFDYDKATVRPEYYRDLDVVAKVLSRSDSSTAIVEGHADRKKGSDANYNMKLSERRARAVVTYLVEQGGIAASRLTPKGFGFTRPRAPNDPNAGNPMNRRVEIYIRGDEQHSQDRVQGSELLETLADEMEAADK